MQFGTVTGRDHVNRNTTAPLGGYAMNHKRSLSILLVAGLAGAGLALAGCHQKQKTPEQQMQQGAQQMGQGVKNAAGQAGQAVSDSAITTKVKGQLAAKQGLSSFDIHVETTNGVVKLTGTVDSAEQRTMAGNVARGTDGVKGVDNEIKVKGG